MSASPWKSNSQSRRPSFKTPPLRLPGQSIDERITSLQKHVDDYLVYGLCFLVVAGHEWIQWWLERPIHPIFLTIVAIGVIGYAVVKIRPLKFEIRNLRMGKDGERIVADMLAPLRENGYRVFHDIPGQNFNIDHVIIGPKGVFTVETKARTKPMQGRPTVVYDGNALRIENGQPFDEPLAQARAQAHWLAVLLNDGRRGRLFTVRPIVVFPEWFIECRESGQNSDVWVLNPKALSRVLDLQPCVLSAEQIVTAAQILTAWDRQSYKATA